MEGKISWGCFRFLLVIFMLFLLLSYFHYRFTSSINVDNELFQQFDKITQKIHNHQASSLVVAEFSKENDKKWLDVLKYGDILVARPFEGRDAYAEKFIIYFNGGKKGSLKLIERSTLFDRGVRENVNFDEVENKGSRRAEAGEYQGMPELVAYHLDRILQFYKKPPTAGRVVPSTLLYSSFLTSLLPSYDIPVIVHAWTSGIKREDPPVELRKYTVLDSLRAPPTISIKEYIKNMSDTLVFDFLVDDHDRAAEKNWIVNYKRERIHWDSGLGWNHGPYADPSCLDILCGSNIWRRTAVAETGDTSQCPRMCVFNNSTIELLKTLGPLAAGPTNKLSYLLRNALETNEKLFPLFQYPIYFSNLEQKELIKYEVESFFTGMDVKLIRLLNHVDQCIAKHGVDLVLLN